MNFSNILNRERRKRLRKTKKNKKNNNSKNKRNKNNNNNEDNYNNNNTNEGNFRYHNYEPIMSSKKNLPEGYNIIIDVDSTFYDYIDKSSILENVDWTFNSPDNFIKNKNILLEKIKANLDKLCEHKFKFRDIKSSLNYSNFLVYLQHNHKILGFMAVEFTHDPSELMLQIICNNSYYNRGGVVLINILKRILKYVKSPKPYISLVSLSDVVKYYEKFGFIPKNPCIPNKNCEMMYLLKE